MAGELDRDLDRWLVTIDPAHAARFCPPTCVAQVPPPSARPPRPRCSATGQLRFAGEASRKAAPPSSRAERGLISETLALLQVRLADAAAALASLRPALEGSQTSMTTAAGELSGVFRGGLRGRPDLEEEGRRTDDRAPAPLREQACGGPREQG
jgi:hypothetical protein